jgi:hypothetical protein
MFKAPNDADVRAAIDPILLRLHRMPSSRWQGYMGITVAIDPSHDRSPGLRAHGITRITVTQLDPLNLAGLQEAWRGWATKQGACSHGSPAIQAGQRHRRAWPDYADRLHMAVAQPKR